jgi:hypothetical protein
MAEDLVSEFEATMEDLLTAIASFNQQQFNTQPFEGGWTAGQVAEHVLKSMSRLPGLLQGGSKPTDGDPYGKTGTIRSVFLDFSTKMKSPDFILPSNELKDKTFFLTAFEKTGKEIGGLIQTIDLSRTFTDFPFPQLGELTGWEWICFAICHTKRHTRQIKAIGEKLQVMQASS